MSITEVSEILRNAKRPINVFGGNSEEDVRKKYRELAKVCHPDLASNEYKSVAERTTQLLNVMYKRALDEIKNGIYNLISKKDIYKVSEPIFEFSFRKKDYSFYEHVCCGDTSDIYAGLLDDELVMLKIASDEADNSLLEEEYKMLSELDHLGVPKPITKILINGKFGIILRMVDGITFDELKENYGNISDNHVAWMMERLLSVIGYLHSKKIVHGNIKPENILIDAHNHNVTLLDYSLSIKNANEEGSKYRIINDVYTPDYVSASARVFPSVDTYAIGKLAIKLLGGDVKSNGMPVNSSSELRKFIRKLVNERCNDAWVLWDELIKLRNSEYGNERFQKLELKRK